MRCDAGIMISASHNPFEDNGIKFFDNHGNKLSVEDEKIKKKYLIIMNFYLLNKQQEKK